MRRNFGPFSNDGGAALLGFVLIFVVIPAAISVFWLLKG